MLLTLYKYIPLPFIRKLILKKYYLQISELSESIYNNQILFDDIVKTINNITEKAPITFTDNLNYFRRVNILVYSKSAYKLADELLLILTTGKYVGSIDSEILSNKREFISYYHYNSNITSIKNIHHYMLIFIGFYLNKEDEIFKNHRHYKAINRFINERNFRLIVEDYVEIIKMSIMGYINE